MRDMSQRGGIASETKAAEGSRSARSWRVSKSAAVLSVLCYEVIGLDAFYKSIEAEHGRFVFTDEGDIGFGGDVEARAPIDGVYDEAAETFILEVGGGAHGGAKDLVGFPGFVFV